MLKNKGKDLLNDSFKERMGNYFNPFEYNLEIKSFKKEEYFMKSKVHEDRKNK